MKKVGNNEPASNCLIQVPACSLLLPISLFFWPLCHPSTYPLLFHPPSYFVPLSPLLYTCPPCSVPSFPSRQHRTFMFTFLHLLPNITSFMSSPHLLCTPFSLFSPSLFPIHMPARSFVHSPAT